MLILLALACAPQSAPPPASAVAPSASVSFSALAPVSIPGAPGILAMASELRRGGQATPLRFQPLISAGVEVDGVLVGATTDASGAPIPWPDWFSAPGPQVCNALDFTSVLATQGGLWHVAHLECPLAGLVVSPLTDTDGSLSLGTPVPVDLAPVHGGHTFCAGTVTPWQTHLGGEEYDGNARVVGADGLLPAAQMDMSTKHPFEWSFLNRHANYRQDVSVYDYGWMFELTVADNTGRAEVVKHFAMGRFSHELGSLMPDRRTVYLTDDEYHAGFYMFVADVAGELSAGKLYAARWRQRGRGARLDWVPLGAADDASLERALYQQRPRFDQLFEAADPAQDGSCPAGLRRVTTTWGAECLRPRDPVLASRLETRRYAAWAGASTELSKNEGLALDPGQGPDSATLYLAMTRINQGMLAEVDEGAYRRTKAQDHIRLPANDCGVVYGLTVGRAVDSTGAEIDSDWVMRRAAPALTGQPQGELCAEGAIANPDNLAFSSALGLLFIAEDTDRHANDLLWAYDPRSQALMPVLAADPASEVSGLGALTFGGRHYLTVTVQWDYTDYPDHHSVAGVLGPF